MKSSTNDNDKNYFFYSVIIPLFNKSLSILITLESVFAQTDDDFEIVIVNDGSTDDGPEKVLALQHSKITLINKENGGVSSARNVAASSANGKFLAFLDADDLWTPDFLAEMRILIGTYPDGGGYGADWIYQDESRQWSDGQPLPEGNLNYFKVSLARIGLCASATVIPKKIFLDLGGFDERLSHGEDLDLWFRLADNYKIYTTGKKLAIYIQDSTNRACLKKITNYEKCFSYYLPQYKKLTNQPYKKYVLKKIKLFSLFLLKKGDFKNLFFYVKKHFLFGNFMVTK